MHNSHSTAPIACFFLVFPSGISSGFVGATLPFALTEAGVPVATSASILALGLSASVWRFLWAPLADLTLNPRGWYAIGVATSAATLLLLSFTPLHEGALLSLVVFLSQVAATLIVLPVGGLMAHTVAEAKKGRAAGWFQAGNLGGAGLGGGAGVWLTDHFSIHVAGAALTTAMLVCLAALAFVPSVRGAEGERLGLKMRAIGRDFRDMLSSPAALLSIVLVVSPIGVGAAGHLWAAVAPDWNASANTVALFTGALSGVASAIGCVAGGLIADRLGRWWAFFGSGALMAAVAVVMTLAPFTQDVYSAGVLSYAFCMGLAYAAFSAIVLHAIGHGAASTKYAILSSLGNVPVVYMTAFDGWLHDRFGVVGMLTGEALIGMACIVLGLVAVWKINSARARTLESAASSVVSSPVQLPTD